ncbi:Tfp pilus assembly protein FimT/FimU [Patescibacteria group bacterium]
MRKGYTLIEILISLTIISILFGIGYVSFRDFSRRQAIQGASKNIIGDLRLTQELALSGEKPSSLNCETSHSLNGYYFRVSVDGNSYSIEAFCTGGVVEKKTVNLAEGLSFSTTSPNPILFKVLGEGTNINGSYATITLNQENTENTVIVTVGKEGEIK